MILPYFQQQEHNCKPKQTQKIAKTTGLEINKKKVK